MTARKYKSYSLWLKWREQGWQVEVTCLDVPWPATNPIRVLEVLADSYSHNYWKRGKTWMILPEGSRPKGA